MKRFRFINSSQDVLDRKYASVMAHDCPKCGAHKRGVCIGLPIAGLHMERVLCAYYEDMIRDKIREC